MSIKLYCTQCQRSFLRSKRSTYELKDIPRARYYSDQQNANKSSSLKSNIDDLSIEEQREIARKKAWYLKDEPPHLTTPPQRTHSHSSATIPTSSSNSSNFIPDSERRSPKFTTFDPSRTTLQLSPIHIIPLPVNAPRYFKALHTFLTSNEVIEPDSVTFLRTDKSSHAKKDREELSGEEKGEVKSSWDWVITGVVKGRGKGVVGRAERMVRLWLKDNPIKELSTTNHPRRMPRIELETDWTIVPIGTSGICINLFTAEGRDKWNLEDLWAEQ